MRYLTRQYIEKKADEVLEQTNSMSMPINIKSVAEKLGLQVVPYELGDDISGVLLVKDGRTTIGYNLKQVGNIVRTRFTIAHELGHYILKHERGGLFVDDYKRHFAATFRNEESSTGEDIQEREANAFAAAILMPKKILINKVSTHRLDFTDDKNLKSLADEFKVSQIAMSYRLANLGILNL